MERAAFLIEPTGERLGCMLNPESIIVRRVAGLAPHRSAGGPSTGAGLQDDPLLFTGGGRTELSLDLLFDVTVAGSTVETEDVRDLTGPLWRLAENARAQDGYSRPPQVLFVLGKAWSVPCVVAAVAERLEHFTTRGTPRRSWLRLRLLRVAPIGEAPGGATDSTALAPSVLPVNETGSDPLVHEVQGAGPASPDGEEGDQAEGAPGQRLDELAYLYYGDASLWRLIAAFNGVVDPLRVAGGSVLRIPPRGAAT